GHGADVIGFSGIPQYLLAIDASGFAAAPCPRMSFCRVSAWSAVGVSGLNVARQSGIADVSGAFWLAATPMLSYELTGCPELAADTGFCALGGSGLGAAGG